MARLTEREVFFWGQDDMRSAVEASALGADQSAPVTDVALAGVLGPVQHIDGRLEFARRRQELIDANPGLQERDLLKMASLVSTLTDALKARGVAAGTATLVAEVAIASFKAAYHRWLTSPSDDGIADHVRAVWSELAGLQMATSQNWLCP